MKKGCRAIMSAINDVIDVLQDKRIIKLRPTHWKARLIVSLAMLFFSVAGVFIADFSPNIAWRYWCFMVPIFAILCITLSLIVTRAHNLDKHLVFHEIFHWVALLGCVYIVSVIVGTGMISYLVGAWFILILLSLTVFLAGIHFDGVFMIIGFLLALLALGSVLFVKYIAVIIIPIALIFAFFLVWRFVSRRGSESDKAV